ncbi:energy transducer TonB [Rhodocytophaga rosea]|uniref:Energy transducer TonB n=1 Tax=Rhodocytophaga rosea TaxID=2704465 RepID=A0A6C0GI06_9BACT|nr:energy transducer TonB [Rhodocytophaga rosea]QHT67691.1 energy transducer TonB [Rhodocytophaga rosea]
MRVKYLFLCIVFLSLAGCTKKTSFPAAYNNLPLTQKGRLLTAHTWKEMSVEVHKFIKGDTIQYDITKQFASVDRDDYTVFYPDGTFLFEEGKSKFTSNSAQKYQRGTWQLQEKEAVLSLTFNQSTDHYAILALTPFKMVLSLAVQTEDASYKYTLTYTPEIENNIEASLLDVPVYTEVEIAPQYPGGIEALGQMIRRKQKYPLEARKKGIEGKVLVEFIIHEDGKPGSFAVVQSLGYGCDEAAVQTLQMMPSWKPGKQKGKPVNVRMSVPIAFKLN